MKKSLLIKNAKIFVQGISEKKDVLCVDGIISEIGENLSGENCQTFDAQGQILSAGFIDIHFHGAAGFDFCDATENSLVSIMQAKLKEGITSIVPATLTLSAQELQNIFENTANVVSKNHKLPCRILGVHLEGPFINPEMAGAQNTQFAQKCDISLVENLNSIFKVLKVSYSPELDENCDFLNQLILRNIVPSCAHSNIGFDEFYKAYKSGLKNITHFGNRLKSLNSRDIGALGAGLIFDDIYLEVIADLKHLSADMLKLIFAKKDLSKIILITDAMRASGCVDGKYSLGGLDVFVKNNEARLANGSLAGSVLKLNDALKNISSVCDLPKDKILEMASFNPARSLGLEKVGKIEVGNFADFAMLDDSFDVLATIVSGEIKYQK